MNFYKHIDPIIESCKEEIKNIEDAKEKIDNLLSIVKILKNEINRYNSNIKSKEVKDDLISKKALAYVNKCSEYWPNWSRYEAEVSYKILNSAYPNINLLEILKLAHTSMPINHPINMIHTWINKEAAFRSKNFKSNNNKIDIDLKKLSKWIKNRDNINMSTAQQIINTAVEDKFDLPQNIYNWIKYGEKSGAFEVRNGKLISYNLDYGNAIELSSKPNEKPVTVEQVKEITKKIHDIWGE